MHAMEGRAILSRQEREALRARWEQRSAQAFERMFGAANQDQLVTFTEREDMACALGEELAKFLLEEHAAADAQVRPNAKRPPCCPKCRQPAERVTKRSAPLPERELTTRAGKVKLQREQWRCKPCRIVFFSAGPAAEVGDGGVQSAAGGEGGAASE
jgi:hypothetical protein